ncbi:MAG: carboxypeptidase-like regulatory domain-containing protein [Planctomycetota bacterium]
MGRWPRLGLLLVGAWCATWPLAPSAADEPRDGGVMLVVRQRGKPLRGAQIQAQRAAGPEGIDAVLRSLVDRFDALTESPAFEARSDAEGRLPLSVSSPGLYLVRVVRGKSEALRLVGVFEGDPMREIEVDLDTTVGKLRVPRVERDVPPRLVLMQEGGHAHVWSLWVTPGLDGKRDLPLPGLGRGLALAYSISGARVLGPAVATIAPDAVTVVQPRTAHVALFDAIQGRVVSATTGAPLAGAQVRGLDRDGPREPAVTTDEQGVFVLPTAAGGWFVEDRRPLLVQVRAPGHVAHVEPVYADESAVGIVHLDHAIRLAPGKPLRGSAPHLAGLPAMDRWIVSAPVPPATDNEPARPDLARAVAHPLALTWLDVDEAGQFEVCVGETDLVLSPRFDPDAASLAPKSLAADTRVAVRAAGPGVRLRGRVLDVSGRPVAGAMVEARLRDGPCFDRTRADEQGAFDVAWAECLGWPAVVAWSETHAPNTGKVSNESGLFARLTLVAGGYVTVRVVDEDGKPLADVAVDAKGSHAVRTDADGRAHLGPLRPGDQRVVAALGSSKLEGSVSVTAGQDAPLVLPLRDITVPRRAKVALPSGVRPEDFRVEVQESDEHVWQQVESLRPRPR